MINTIAVTGKIGDIKVFILGAKMNGWDFIDELSFDERSTDECLNDYEENGKVKLIFNINGHQRVEQHKYDVGGIPTYDYVDRMEFIAASPSWSDEGYIRDREQEVCSSFYLSGNMLKDIKNLVELTNKYKVL